MNKPQRTACTSPACIASFEAGRDQERAAIVAWLRDEDRQDWATRYMVAALERGEHLGASDE